MIKNIIFAAVIVFIVVLLYIISIEKFALVPSDKDHINIVTEEACLDCHGEERENPLSKEHPPKHQCFECHERGLESEK